MGGAQREGGEVWGLWTAWVGQWADGGGGGRRGKCIGVVRRALLLWRQARPTMSDGQHDVGELALGIKASVRVHTVRERRLLAKVTEVFKGLLRLELRAFELQRAEEPLHFFYSSDTTPTTTEETWTTAWGLTKIRRRGRACGEYLAQRFVVLDGRGERKTVLAEPAPLVGATSWTHISAYVDLFEQPKQNGHLSISHHHHVWDRAIFEKCRRHALQSVKALRVHHDDLRGSRAAILELKLWCALVPCCSHDVHNALRWAVLEYCSDAAALRSLLAQVERLRSGQS